METWRKTFRILLPMLSEVGLEALRKGLQYDDPKLIQNATTLSPMIQWSRYDLVYGACLFSYPGWRGDGLKTVEEVEERFAKLCYEIDTELGELAGCRWLLNYYDQTPRDEVRRTLLPEVIREQARREVEGYDGTQDTLPAEPLDLPRLPPSAGEGEQPPQPSQVGDVRAGVEECGSVRQRSRGGEAAVPLR